MTEQCEDNLKSQFGMSSLQPETDLPTLLGRRPLECPQRLEDISEDCAVDIDPSLDFVDSTSKLGRLL